MLLDGLDELGAHELGASLEETTLIATQVEPLHEAMGEAGGTEELLDLGDGARERRRATRGAGCAGT